MMLSDCFVNAILNSVNVEGWCIYKRQAGSVLNVVGEIGFVIIAANYGRYFIDYGIFRVLEADWTIYGLLKRNMIINGKVEKESLAY